MSEEPASVCEFIANGDGLKVSVGGVETHFVRDPGRELTVSITEWRTILQATDFRERQDGTPTLLSHRMRAEAVGKLRGPIGFINAGPESGEIKELPVDIHQYDADAAQHLERLRDAGAMLRGEEENPLPQFYKEPHTAILNFDPNDVVNNKYYPSTFLTIYVSKDIMEDFCEFTNKNKRYEINFYLKFFNLFRQVGDGNISYSPLALCSESGNVLYGNLVSFALKSIDENRADPLGAAVSFSRENHSQRDQVSANLRFHQATVQENLQKISETLSYVLYVLCIVLIVMIFK